MKRMFLCTVLLLVLAFPAAASELPDFPFAYVTGNAEIEVPPDIATTTFRIEAFDKESERVMAAVEERSEEVVSLLEKYGIKRKDIVSYELRKTTVREQRNYTRLGILGYEVDRRFSITIRELERYGALAEALLNVENLTELNTVFDTTRRKAIEKDLIAQASANAREKADALAKGYGTQIEAVFAITADDTGFRHISGVFGLRSDSVGRAEAKLAAGSTLFVPTTIKFGRTATAIYRLEE